jgi:hypothetical protein
MSDTRHHARKQNRRWRHAPAWFRRMLNRLYRRKANRELARSGEVVTKRPKGALYEWL